jgi:Protein of unknown function DUF262/Protein of unknown function (DUF1524)
MNNVLNVEELFSGRLFVVPDYQRGYSWEQRQWNEFLEDIEMLPEHKDHFTGTVVLHETTSGSPPIDEAGKRYSYFNIVDGQQRLTTIVLLLNAIRYEIQAFSRLATLTSGVANSYLFVNDLNGERIHKLTLNRDCQTFFVNNILADPPGPEGPVIASHQRLRDAKRHFRTYLTRRRSAASSDDPAWLVQLHDKVTHRLRLSLYIVDEASDVGVIFEVMNNRGKPLSELEKVKNYLLYVGSKLNLAPHTLADNVNQTWTNVFERLMAGDLSSSKEEDQLLRMHWLMAYDYRSRNFEGSNSIKARFRLRDYQDQHKELLAQLQRYSKTLDQATVAYSDIMNPRRTEAFSVFTSTPSLRNEIIVASEKLERINVVATFLPLLMAMRLRFPEEGQKYLEVVRLCEVFAFRVYRLLQRRADAGQKTIFRVANELFADAVPFEEAMRQLRSALLGYCSNHSLAERFQLREQDNNWYIWPGLKYLLYEYEEHLARHHTVQLPWHAVAKRPAEQTIEHILPQSPSDPYWTARFDEEALRCFQHDIGNLCLTVDNSEYGNRPFPEKKGRAGSGAACYSNSNLFQERELAAVDDWTVDSIKNRREKLVQWAIARWHVDETDATPLAPEEDDD